MATWEDIGIKTQYDGTGTEQAKRGLKELSDAAGGASGSYSSFGSAGASAGETIREAFMGAYESVKSTYDNIADAGRKITDVGESMKRGLTDPIIGFGKGIIETAGNFQAQMNVIQAVTESTTEEFSLLREQAIDLGSSTVFSATEAAEAMTFLGKAGFDAQQTFGAMPATLDLAAASGMGLGDTADGLTSILRGFNLEVEDAAHLTDVLTQATIATNSDFTDLIESFKYAGPVLNQVNESIEETSGMIGLMANAGIKGSMAGTSLRSAVTRLLAPTDQMSAAMERLGVTALDNEGEFVGLTDIVIQLEGAFGKFTNEELVKMQAGFGNLDSSFFDANGNILDMKGALGSLGETMNLNSSQSAALSDLMVVFGQRAGPAMAALVSQGSDALIELTAELENSEGAAKRMGDVTMAGFNGALDEMKSAFEGLQIAIADSGLLEFVTGIVKAIAGFISKLSETNPAVLRVITVILSLVATIGPLLIMAGKVTTAVGQLGPAFHGLGGIVKGIGPILSAVFTGPAAPFVIAGIAIVALATLIIANWDKIKEWTVKTWGNVKTFMTNTWADIKTGTTNGWNTIKTAFSDAMGGIYKKSEEAVHTIRWYFVDKFTEFHGAIRTAINAVGGFFTKMKDGVVSTVKNMVESVTDWLTNKWEKAKEGAKGLWNNVKDGAKGLFDALVGHSIIPDMVDAVGDEFSRMADETKRHMDTFHEVVTKTAKSAKKELKGLFDLEFSIGAGPTGGYNLIKNHPDRFNATGFNAGPGGDYSQIGTYKKPEAGPSVFDKISGMFRKNFKYIDEAIEIFSKVKGSVAPFLSMFADIPGWVADKILNTDASAFWGNLDQAFRDIGAFGASIMGSSFVQSIGGVMERVGGVILPALEMFSGSLSWLSEGMGLLLNSVINLMLGSTALKDTLSIFMTTIGPSIEALAAVFSWAIQPILSFVGALVMMVADWLQPIFYQFGMVIQSLQPIFDVLGRIVAAVLNITAPFIPFLLQLVQIVGAVLTPILKAIAPVLEIVGELFTFLSPVLQVVAYAFKILATPIVLIISVFEWLINIVRNFGRFIVNVISHPLRPSRWDENFVSANLGDIMRENIRELWSNPTKTATGSGMEFKPVSYGNYSQPGGSNVTWGQYQTGMHGFETALTHAIDKSDIGGGGFSKGTSGASQSTVTRPPDQYFTIKIDGATVVDGLNTLHVVSLAEIMDAMVKMADYNKGLAVRR